MQKHLYAACTCFMVVCLIQPNWSCTFKDSVWTTDTINKDPRPLIPPGVIALSVMRGSIWVFFGFLSTKHAKTNAKPMHPQSSRTWQTAIILITRKTQRSRILAPCRDKDCAGSGISGIYLWSGHVHRGPKITISCKILDWAKIFGKKSNLLPGHYPFRQTFLEKVKFLSGYVCNGGGGYHPRPTQVWVFWLFFVNRFKWKYTKLFLNFFLINKQYQTVVGGHAKNLD